VDLFRGFGYGSSMTLPTLIGLYDSPFVRRVAIAMRLYEMPFEHESWSVFRHAELIAARNPLRRAPSLVLPSGEVLVDSFAILDHLDEQVTDAQLLLPRRGPARRAGLRISALAAGVADKAVALVVEREFREPGTQSVAWVRRCEQQVTETLLLLERERSQVATEWWLGDRLSHADIIVATAYRFLREGQPDLRCDVPVLQAHCARCEALPVFQEISLPLVVPPRSGSAVS
jgi:glutathione S-transferase